MPDSLDSIHQAFVTYRQTHRRGAYPLSLRRRAVAALTVDARLELAARLGLTADQVHRWNVLSESHSGTPQFFEVPSVVAQPSVQAGLCVEVQMPNGVILRLRGEIDANVLAMVMTVARAEAVAA